MQRYFIHINNENIIFSENDVFHITKVMRGKINDHIQVVDIDTKKVYLAVIASINPLRVEIVEPINENTELNKEVTLFFALAKSDKNDFVIQKATELGASKVVLFQGERSVVKYSDSDFARKKERYVNIAKEAAEQCHRQLIPEIIYLSNINRIESYLADVNLFAYECEAGKSSDIENLTKDSKSVSIIIGPEGGFSLKEADYLKSLKFVPISLGNRILRCETAAVYSLSVISHILEK